jgi:hypothetical protein
MGRQLSLPMNFKITELLGPQTDNAALTTQIFTLKNAVKAWALFQFKHAVGFASTPTLIQCTSIAGTTNKAGPSVPIWWNLDNSLTDTLVKQTDAALFAIDANAKRELVVFELDPARFDVNNGYDCGYFTIATSSQATDFVSALLITQSAYESGTPPSAILD